MDGGDFGGVEEVLNPSAKHREEERQRVENTWVIEGGHEPGCGPIDLDSGTVVVGGSGVEAVLPERPRLEESEDDDEDPPEV